MSLIQLLKLREVEMGLYKMPHFETPVSKQKFSKQGLQLPLG